MNDDRELLEKAAKAVNNGAWHPLTHDTPNGVWNPLTDDGDALRLAVKLGIMFCRRMNINGQFAVAEAEGQMFCPEPWLPDPLAATRRAIVRAAAEIGRAMP